jgi:hypothetical protein
MSQTPQPSYFISRDRFTDPTDGDFMFLKTSAVSTPIYKLSVYMLGTWVPVTLDVRGVMERVDHIFRASGWDSKIANTLYVRVLHNDTRHVDEYVNMCDVDKKAKDMRTILIPM